MRQRDDSDFEKEDIYEDMLAGFWKGQQDAEDEHKVAIAKLIERGAFGALLGGALGIALAIFQANVITEDLDVLRGFLAVVLPLGGAVGGMIGGVAWDVRKSV